MSHESQTQKLIASLGIPVAIIVAGALIALAVLFSGERAPKVQTLEEVLVKIAKASDINTKDFTACLKSGRHAGKVEASVDDATGTGGSGTPWSIIVGPTGKKYPLSGAQPIVEIRKLLDLALADSPVPANPKNAALENMLPVTANDHIKGSVDYPVKIVEYSDLECPFCKRFHATLEQVINEQKYKGKVAWVYRHFPLESLHSKAPLEAEAAECAAELGGNEGFWKFVDKINEITPANNKLDQAQI